MAVTVLSTTLRTLGSNVTYYTMAYGLTLRQEEVVRLACQGLGNKEIAAKLFISIHTVKFTLRIVYAKLGWHGGDRNRLFIWGVNNGLVMPDKIEKIKMESNSLWPEPVKIDFDAMASRML